VLSREIGFAAPGTWRAASRYFHDRFGALVDLSPFAARCFHKPLDLRQLFGGISAGITIEQEATGVNLFAVISA
jgi:hypothetical protein